MVAVAAERTPSGGSGRAHLRVVADGSAATLAAAARATIRPTSLVRTDGGYRGLGSAGYDHLPRTSPRERPSDVDEWLPYSHLVLANFKRWTLDIFHGVSSRQLQAYLDAFCYRLNRRSERRDLFRRILNRCLLCTEPITSEVERWFAEFAERWRWRGSHRLTKGAGRLDPHLDHGLERGPRPFVWHRSADEILQSLASYCVCEGVW